MRKWEKYLGRTVLVFIADDTNVIRLCEKHKFMSLNFQDVFIHYPTFYRLS